MNLREALISQGPSLELHRAAQAEIARLDGIIEGYRQQVIAAAGELARLEGETRARAAAKAGDAGPRSGAGNPAPGGSS